MQKIKLKTIYFFLIMLLPFLARGQLLDNYDGIANLSYHTEGTWQINDGIYIVSTNGISGPEHSYAAYDLSQSNPTWATLLCTDWLYTSAGI